jgi:hypothetical protein
VLRATGTVFQATEIIGVIAPFPAIKGLRANAEVAASEPSVIAMGAIIIKPF